MHDYLQEFIRCLSDDRIQEIAGSQDPPAHLRLELMESVREYRSELELWYVYQLVRKDTIRHLAAFCGTSAAAVRTRKVKYG